MIRPSQTAERSPDIKYVSITGWPKGYMSRLDDDRIPNDALSTTENVISSQNGTIKPRPGLKEYGVQPTGTVRGQIYEFVKFNGTIPETWLIWMEDRSGTGTVIVSKNGGAHTVVTGKTYDSTAKAHFEQVYGVVLITNGVDNLSYMDISTLTITPLTALATPNAPTLAATGVGGTTYSLRYKVTATNSGETAASAATSVGISKVRDLWNGTTEFMAITITRVTGAARYNIYLGDQAGFEYFLDSVPDPGSGTTFTYNDIGSIATNVNRLAPLGDSTSGPKTTRVTNIKGQPYMVGDADNPGRIWFGGTGASALDFSSYNGGGWVEPNKGGKDFPVKAMPFRDGKGTPMAAVLSKGTNGTGKRYLLSPTTTTVGDTVISYMNVVEDNGQDGTDSPDGVVLLDDALWYPSRTSFKTTTTRAQIQNILSTTGISDNIAPDVNSLSSLYMDSCVGMANDRTIYWAVPFASTTNNQIWLLDLRQKGAWMRPLNIAADWLTLYADNSDGKTKSLALVANKIVEFDVNSATNDNGTPFLTNIGSGAIKFSEDGMIWGSVLDVTFVFLRPQGSINLSVIANTEDGLITLTDIVTSATTESVSAWGSYGFGTVGWGNLPYGEMRAVASSKPRVEKKIDVDEEVNYLNFGVNTVDAGVSYELSEVIVAYVPVGRKDIED